MVTFFFYILFLFFSFILELPEGFFSSQAQDLLIKCLSNVLSQNFLPEIIAQTFNNVRILIEADEKKQRLAKTCIEFSNFCENILSFLASTILPYFSEVIHFLFLMQFHFLNIVTS